MRIVVCTDNADAVKHFRALKRSGSFTVERAPIADATNDCDRDDSMLYVDAAGFSRPELRRVLQELADQRRPFGVLDETDSVIDVAELFHQGACDYIGSHVLNDGLATARVRRALAHFDRRYAFDEEATPQTATTGRSPQLVGDRSDDGIGIVAATPGWDSITDGGEYSFYMLFAGLDPISSAHRESTDRSLRDTRSAFRDLFTRYFGPAAGRVFMWKEDSGILLFPFDPASPEPVVLCFRLMLNKVIVQTEHLSAFGPVTWRLALHVGRTTYRSAGHTDTIVSESVNHVFHIGSNFLPADSCYLTGEAMRTAPEGLRTYFVGEGTYERSKMYRMRIH